jgi:hypothetical protein
MANIRVSRTVLLAGVAAALMLMVPATAAAHVGVGFGFWGPVYPAYWGPYPYAYPVYGYPYYGYGYGYGYRPMGEVKIRSAEPDADIYINGSLAGQAHSLKKFHLRPGTYDIEQRIGGDVQHRRVYVIANRTIRLEFGPAGAGVPDGNYDRDYDYDRDHHHHRDGDHDHDRDDY